MRPASFSSSILQFSMFCALAHSARSSKACIWRPFVSHASSKAGLTFGTRMKSIREGTTFSLHSRVTKSAVFLLSIAMRGARKTLSALDTHARRGILGQCALRRLAQTIRSQSGCAVQ